MRRIIIDTDTASDDASAIIMALRSDKIKVEMISVVAGNVPINLACKNALISVEKSNSYNVPVYKGASKPLDRELYTAEFAHGLNGMGDIKLDEPKIKLKKDHAIDAMISLIDENPNEIEIMAIGPLTNIALAINKNPEVMKKVKRLYLMGGNGLKQGNITEHAEFNYYVDPLAANIVTNFYNNIYCLPWHTCLEGVYIRDNDIDRIRDLNPLGKFFVDINSTLIKYSNENHGINGFVLCDAGIIAIMIDETISLEEVNSSLDVVVHGDKAGKQIQVKKEDNHTICTNLNYTKFVDLIIDLLN